LQECLGGARESLLIPAGERFEWLQFMQWPSVFGRSVFCILQAEVLVRPNIQNFGQLDYQIDSLRCRCHSFFSRLRCSRNATRVVSALCAIYNSSGLDMLFVLEIDQGKSGMFGLPQQDSAVAACH
jgi:hypothetical protein